MSPLMDTNTSSTSTAAHVGSAEVVASNSNLSVSKPSAIKLDGVRGPSSREIMIFSDFDGTIFMQDSGHVLFDHFGCGPEQRAQWDREIHEGTRSFREVSEDMWNSLNVPFNDGFKIMREKMDIDPDFKHFHQFCLKNEIPFNVISAGVKPVLRRVLEDFLGEKDAAHIDIVANDMNIAEDGSQWEIQWRHDTPLGHDKAASIQEYKQPGESGQPPMIIFIGDGVSDLPAAREADVLFARRGLRLEEYCIEHAIPFIAYDTFRDIENELRRILIEDQRSIEEVGTPKYFNPRANFWRRASSKKSLPAWISAAGRTPREERGPFWDEYVNTANAPKAAVMSGEVTQ
ncbi:hypothetical protein YB2330_002721 [Saitoella coloradoensis]